MFGSNASRIGLHGFAGWTINGKIGFQVGFHGIPGIAILILIHGLGFRIDNSESIGNRVHSELENQ